MCWLLEVNTFRENKIIIKFCSRFAKLSRHLEDNRPDHTKSREEDSISYISGINLQSLENGLVYKSR